MRPLAGFDTSPVQGDRVTAPTGAKVGRSKAAKGSHSLGSVGTVNLLGVRESTFVQRDGIFWLPGALVAVRQPAAGEGSVRMVSPEQVNVGRQQRLPVGDGRSGQPGTIQALASPSEHRVTAPAPQEVSGRFM